MLRGQNLSGLVHFAWGLAESVDSSRAEQDKTTTQKITPISLVNVAGNVQDLHDNADQGQTLSKTIPYILHLYAVVVGNPETLHTESCMATCLEFPVVTVCL